MSFHPMTAYDFELGSQRLLAVLRVIREAQRLGYTRCAVMMNRMDNIIARILASRYGCTAEIAASDYRVWVISWE